MPIQGVVPSSLPLGIGAPVLLFLLELVPVPEELGSRMKVLVWVCKSLQCLRVPQVYKELVSRKFTSSKEPLLIPDLNVLDDIREVADVTSFSHLDTLDRSRSIVLQSNLKSPVEPEDL